MTIVSDLQQNTRSAISILVKVAEQVGMNIRVIRTRKKLSQASLGERSGIERHHLSDIELGKVNISLQTMVRIVIALGCQLTDIVEGVKLSKR